MPRSLTMVRNDNRIVTTKFSSSVYKSFSHLFARHFYINICNSYFSYGEGKKENHVFED